MADINIANETVDKKSSGQRWTVSRVILSRPFLYCVSFCSFIAVWMWLGTRNLPQSSIEWTLLDRITSSLAPPWSSSVDKPGVVQELLFLAGHKFAGGTLWDHIWASTYRVIIGFLIASGIGLSLGIFMALNRRVNAIVKPIFDLFKPMPPIAWISLAILWLGTGETSKVFIIVIGSFAPCLIDTYNGVKLVDPELYDAVRVLGGKRREEIFHACLPAALPAIFAGLQICLTICWTCVLAAELVSSRNGLGFLIKRGMDAHEPALTICGMCLIAFLAWITSYLMGYAQRKLCPWQNVNNN